MRGATGIILALSLFVALPAAGQTQSRTASKGPSLLSSIKALKERIVTGTRTRVLNWQERRLERNVHKAYDYLASSGMRARVPVEVVSEEKLQRIVKGHLREAELLKGARPGSRAAERRTLLLKRVESANDRLVKARVIDQAVAHYDSERDVIVLRSERVNRRQLLVNLAHELQHASDRHDMDLEMTGLQARREQMSKRAPTTYFRAKIAEIDRMLEQGPIIDRALEETRAFGTESYIAGRAGHSSRNLPIFGVVEAEKGAYPPEQIANETISRYLQGSHDALLSSKRYQRLSPAARDRADARVVSYLNGYGEFLTRWSRDGFAQRNGTDTMASPQKEQGRIRSLLGSLPNRVREGFSITKGRIRQAAPVRLSEESAYMEGQVDASLHLSPSGRIRQLLK